MKNLYKSITCLLILSLIIQTGCYTMSRGDFIGYTEVSGSETLLNYTYYSKVSSEPTFNRPLLIIKFNKTPAYQYEALETYEEIRTPNKGANTLPNILFYGGLIASIGGLVLIADTSASRDKKETGGIILGSGAAAVLIGALTKVDDKPKVTENKITGNTVKKERPGNQSYLNNTAIKVTIDKDIKTYKTNPIGEITVDLVKDFNLLRFENEKDISVGLDIIIDEISTKHFDVKLKSSSWTTKYFTIIADEIQVYDTPGSLGKKLGICKKLEKHQVLDNNSNWTKIDYNGQSGWVSSYAGNYIWESK